jgi:hypothetical protein
VVDEGTQELRLTLDRPCMTATDDRQFVHVRARKIRQGLRLEVAPSILDGIQFGRVRREIDVAGAGTGKEVPDGGRPVRIGSVPHEHHRRVQVPMQVLAEGQHGLGVEVLLDEQLKIQTDGAALRADAQGGDHRDLSAVAADVPQHRGLSSRPPRAAHDGQQEQPAFVDEDEPRAQAVGFFLMRGQSCLTQRRIPSSFRSQARRTGRCGVQPSARSNRPM